MSDAGEQVLLEHLGGRALSFLIAVDLETLLKRIQNPRANRLSKQREQVLANLVAIDPKIAPTGANGDHWSQWANFLSSTVVGAQNYSIGNFARACSGGEILQIEPFLGQLEQHLSRLAIDIYPSLLVKDPNTPPPFQSITSFIFQHPSNSDFQSLALSDPDFRKIFTEESGSTGWRGTVVRSTGAGGSIQLSMFAAKFIISGWHTASLKDVSPTPLDFVSTVRRGLQKTRDAINKRSVHVAARTGLVGMLLPDSVNLVDLQWARIRRSDDRDKPYIHAAGPNAQLTGTNKRGQTAVIQYHGDLVLEVDVPYKVEIGELSLDEPWPEHLLVSSRDMDIAIDSIRLGLLLALPDRRGVLHTSWETFEDPLMDHPTLHYSDLSRAVGLRPTKLTVNQVQKWKEWSELVHEQRTAGSSKAVRRTLAAISDRMLAAVSVRLAPEDVLIDAVVVWEHLFGAKSEVALRVCSSLSWLLGTSAPDRKIRFARYKKIYNCRSEVVHGALPIKQKEVQEYAQEAADITIDALRAILKKCPHLLELSTSEERSVEVMLGGYPKGKRSSTADQ